GAARAYLAPVPTYAAGMLALVVAARSERAILPKPEVLHRRFLPLRGRTRYYSPETHQAAFMIAEALQRANTTSAASPSGDDSVDRSAAAPARNKAAAHRPVAAVEARAERRNSRAAA